MMFSCFPLINNTSVLGHAQQGGLGPKFTPSTSKWLVVDFLNQFAVRWFSTSKVFPGSIAIQCFSAT